MALQKCFLFYISDFERRLWLPSFAGYDLWDACISIAVSSIPEVCGNNVLYFDPHNVLEIENRITYLYSEKYLYKKLSIEGMRHAQTIKDNKEQNLENIVNFIFSDTNRS